MIGKPFRGFLLGFRAIIIVLGAIEGRLLDNISKMSLQFREHPGQREFEPLGLDIRQKTPVNPHPLGHFRLSPAAFLAHLPDSISQANGAGRRPLLGIMACRLSPTNRI